MILGKEKKCCVCNKILPIEDFCKNVRVKSGFIGACKSCRKKRRILYKEKLTIEQKQRFQLDWGLKKSYGISLQEYEEMLKNQDNKCAICGKEEIGIDKRTNKPRRLAVDHDHATGKVRALLCNKCNNGLGCFEDNVELTKLAINYLIKYKNE